LVQLQQNPGQFLARYMEQRGVGKDPVKTALGQLHSQEILMQDLAARMCPRHRDELPRSIEPNGFDPYPWSMPLEDARLKRP
jgi:hypothetical protein